VRSTEHNEAASKAMFIPANHAIGKDLRRRKQRTSEETAADGQVQQAYYPSPKLFGEYFIPGEL
jgi:hypothetical protein